MFRAANNPYDDAVVKATDENLTSENWAYILDVCDRVSASPQGPASVIAALIKRLAHRNANVQLYTLELANALSQNCGPPLHRELASRSFTDALLRLANDRNTHTMVKTKVMERMEGWTDMFGKDPDLGIMQQAYEKLRAGNPGLAPPSKPVKKGMSAEDRRKEDDELQMALALSLKDKAGDGPDSATPTNTGTVGSDAQMSASQGGQQPGTTAATVSRVKALYDFTPSEPGELAFRTGDIIAVLESVYKDWWKGSLRGQTGIFPLNYVEKLQDPTVEELERDAAMEGDVFSQIRNVEKLLSLLSVRQDGMGGSRDAGSEEEITELYNQTLAIRPKLIELIGKYSQKKDDFTQLNEKFIKARRDYEALLEFSMSAPQQYDGQQRQPSQPYYANAYGPPQPYAQQQHQPYAQQPPPSQDPRYTYGAAAADSQPTQQPPYSYNNTSVTPAPAQAFHFLPNGGPPPQDSTPKPGQGNLPPPSMPTPDQPYSPQQTSSQQYPQTMLPSARPGSIHTLNSGNPQELGTYESPTEPRHNAYPSQQTMPLRHQHTNQSLDSPSVYSPQTPSGPPDGAYAPYTIQAQQAPTMPNHAPPAAPPAAPPPTGMMPAGTYSGPHGLPAQGGYQAYNPQMGASAPPPAAGGRGDADDASDFYR
ncbi:hypothetical protein BDV97DRAFT_295695 [Delphinella strobiligena]|nr:hypothetical protein BDV97DRAFT_295695 [Delphinella strobiligena]